MVVSTAKQLESTYQLWQRFTYPSENGPRDAVAVPSWVGDQLNAAYALIIEMAVIHVWSILFGLVIYSHLRRYKMEVTKLSPMAPTIWNKRADLLDSIIETVTSGDGWKTPTGMLLLFLILVAWVGQMATGVLVPPLIILNHSAPVNPEAIYVPDRSGESLSSLASLFQLEAPRMQRALGSTAVDTEIRKRVEVSQPVREGTTGSGEEVLRFNYKYKVTGQDLGLQKSQELTLSVEGSCVTEYTWHDRTGIGLSGQTIIAVDYYDIFYYNRLGPQPSASLFDGPHPSARFYIGNNTEGELPTSNATWAALVSSVNRTSFNPGTDPWYLTSTVGAGESDALYTVRPARPVLSCWEDNVWSYDGRKASVENLSSDVLPGLELSSGLVDILISFLGSPVILKVGQHLQASALASTTTASGQYFDARGSSIHADLERLVQTAYVATVNTLTDMTLYPPGANTGLRNVALGPSGEVLDGVADFVLWTPDVSALSVLVLILVPSVFVGAWVLALVLLYWTPIRAVNLLDSAQEHQNLNTDEATKPMVQDQEQGLTGTQ